MNVMEQSKAFKLTKVNEIPQKRKPDPNMNLLLICKDFSLYDLIKNSAIASRWNIFFNKTTDDILSSVKMHDIHVTIIEKEKTRKEAIDLLKKLKKFDSLLDMIVLGESFSPEEVMNMINHGATDFLTKPFKLRRLEQTLKKNFKKRNIPFRKETGKKIFFSWNDWQKSVYV